MSGAEANQNCLPNFLRLSKKVPWPEAEDGAEDGLLYSQGLDLVEFLLSNIIVGT